MIPPLRSAAILTGLVALTGILVAHGQDRTPGDQRLGDLATQTVGQLIASPPDDETVVVAGDSHAGGIAGGSLCGVPARSAAVGGITVPLYHEAWTTTALGRARRYRAIVLEIGTNDQQAKRDPVEHEAAFRAEMTDLVGILRSRTRRLIVLAIPPNRHPKVESRGVRQRNAFLTELCATQGCRVLDPFADSRESDGETMRDGYSVDGVHYKDYQAIRDRIEKATCMK